MMCSEASLCWHETVDGVGKACVPSLQLCTSSGMRLYCVQISQNYGAGAQNCHRQTTVCVMHAAKLGVT